MKTVLRAHVVAVAILVSLFAVPTRAGTVILDAFDYGTTAGTIGGANGGSGWLGAWVVNGTANAQYQTTSLSIATAGYTNANSVGSGSLGLVGLNTNAASTYSTNNETRPALDLSVVGTQVVWMSYLINISDTAVSANDQIYLYLGGQANNSLRVQGASGGYSLNGFYNGTSAGTKILSTGANSGTLLVLAKLSLTSATGTNGTLGTSGDSYQLWFNPSNLTAGEAGLGTADITTAANTSIFANTGTANLQFAFQSKTSSASLFVDDIRVSYGFDTSDASLNALLSGQIQPVPEPGTASLAFLGLGFLGLAKFRFGKRRVQR